MKLNRKQAWFFVITGAIGFLAWTALAVMHHTHWLVDDT
jgi:hypothetical protein